MVLEETKHFKFLCFFSLWFFIFLGDFDRHYEISFISIYKFVQYVAFSWECLCWCTEQISESFACFSIDDSFIAAMNLGPGFFEDSNPELITVSLGKERLLETFLICNTRYFVIQNDLTFLTAFGHRDLINTHLIFIFCRKHIHNPFRIFRNGAQRAQKVAVS